MWARTFIDIAPVQDSICSTKELSLCPFKWRQQSCNLAVKTSNLCLGNIKKFLNSWSREVSIPIPFSKQLWLEWAIQGLVHCILNTFMDRAVWAAFPVNHPPSLVIKSSLLYVKSSLWMQNFHANCFYKQTKWMEFFVL